MMTRQIKEPLKVLFAQSIVFIILVLLLEIILWVFFRVPNDTHIVNVLPGEDAVVVQNLPGLKTTIHYKSGKYGLRSISPIEKIKKSDSVRILCIGASTTDQSTQETQDTWCGVLESKLLKHYDHLAFTIQTMGFGAGGFRAMDDAFWIKEAFDWINPDIVITLLGVNDLALNGGPKYTYRSDGVEKTLLRKSQNWKKRIKKREGAFIHWCRNYSQVCRRVSYIMRNLAVQKKLETGEVIEWHSSNLPGRREKYRNLPYVQEPSRIPDPINEFSDVINWIITFFKSSDVRVIILGQPVLWKKTLEPDEYNSLWFQINTSKGPVRASGAWLEREMAKYNEIQQATASQSGMKYIDLDKKIPKTLDYYFDDCHFTDLGSILVADSILPVVIEEIDDVALRKALNK